MARALPLCSLAVSCVLSEVTVVPSLGGGEAGTTTDAGAAGKSTATAGNSSGPGAGGDQNDAGAGTSTAGANGNGGNTNTAGTSQAGASAGGSPNTGGQTDPGDGGEGGAPFVDPDRGPFKVLVVSAVAGYEHPTIMNAVDMVAALGATADAALPTDAKPGSQFTSTVLSMPANLDSITTAYLANYRVLFFAHPTGELFSGRPNGTQIMAAIEAFMNAGGGWVGINGAIEVEPTSLWAWYQNNLTGSLPGSHSTSTASINWAATNHPVIRGLSSPWACNDEWYTLPSDPRAAGFSILGSLATSGTPVLWAKEFGTGGRSVYTTLGHPAATYSNVNFTNVMLRSILWAANRLE